MDDIKFVSVRKFLYDFGVPSVEVYIAENFFEPEGEPELTVIITTGDSSVYLGTDAVDAVTAALAEAKEKYAALDTKEESNDAS